MPRSTCVPFGRRKPETRLNMRNVVARALPTGEESRALLRLALPVVVVQVGIMAMGVVDTIMVGHLSATALAAVALGNLYFFGCAILGMGALMGLDPVVAQALGAGDHPAVARGVQRGLILAVVLSVPAAIALLYAEPVLRALGQPAEVVPLAGAYARWTAPERAAALPLRGAAPEPAGAARHAPDHHLHPRRQHHQRLPQLGADLRPSRCAGAWRHRLGDLHHHRPLGPALHAARARLARTRAGAAAPAGARRSNWRRSAACSASACPSASRPRSSSPPSARVGLMMGRLGTIPVAAHQVAINLASLTFMVPLGMGQAAAVLVGHAIGAADHARRPPRRARRDRLRRRVHGDHQPRLPRSSRTGSRTCTPTTLPPLRSPRRCCPLPAYSSSSTAPRPSPPASSAVPATPGCPC